MEFCDTKMNDQESTVESGIDLGFDLTNIDTDQLFQELELLDDGDGASFYQLKSKPVGGSPPTSLKLVTMPTRTNLKQFLQMQQVQEQERKEQEQAKQTTAPLSKNTLAVNVPPTTAGAPRMDVPSEVLKVNSRLENPTQFHVIQRRKRQVEDYLNMAQGNGRSLLVHSVPSKDGAQGAAASAPAAASTSLQHLSNSAPSPDSPNSVALSSSATSASEADVIDTIIQMESSMDTDGVTFLQTSTMPPDDNFLNIINGCGVPSPASSSKSCPADENVKHEAFRFGDCSLHVITKDRQKKDNHNMIERRRRFNINDRIKELGTLLPKTNDPYFDVVRIERQNKGTILKAAVDLIKELKRDVDRLTTEAKEKKRLEHENWKLKHQFQQLVNMYQQATSVSSPEITYLLDTTTTAIPKEEEGPFEVKQEPVETLGSHILSPVSLDDLMEDDRHPVNGDPMMPCPLVNDDMEFAS